MGSFEIPLVPSIGLYRLTTTLDQVDYIFDVHWNTRDSSWYFDVLEADETPIAQGLRIVLGTFIGRRHNDHPLFKDGVFVAVDTTGRGIDAGFDDLGVRVKLQYVPVEEMLFRIYQGRLVAAGLATQQQ